MKNNNKISLLKDIKKTAIKEGGLEDYKNQHIVDERIIAEKNKVMSAAYNILVGLLIILSIVGETFNWKVDSLYVFGLIGIISYGMLLTFCKKVAILENQEAAELFVWSFITLPLSIYHVMLNLFRGWLIKEALIVPISLTIAIGVIIIIAIIMYQIANFVYKRAHKQ